MTTPSFDSVEARASYGIGLQVGQQLQVRSGRFTTGSFAGRFVAFSGKSAAVPVDVVHRALREIRNVRMLRRDVNRRWPLKARNSWKTTPNAKLR